MRKSKFATLATPRQTVPTIQAKSLSKSFGRNKVIQNLDLNVYGGEILALAGASGSGKTTLLNILAGLDKPSSGSISAPKRTQRGFVFQDYNLLEALTAADNATLSARLLGRPVRKDEVRSVFDELGLVGLENRMPHQLSGGQQQRVAIARVLLAKVPFVFADEPTGALDSKSADIVLKNLRTVADRGATVVIVTHSREGVAAADRVLQVGELH